MDNLAAKPNPARKNNAEVAELATLDDQGFLHSYRVGEIEVPEVQLLIVCSRCGREDIFLADRKADAIRDMRNAGWAWDSSVDAHHLCPDCLDKVPS